MNLDPHQLYLGKETEGGEPLLYDGDDFTTHGVIVGMTGSGKTGLGIGIVEEALLNDIPCLIIDPKGDMGNLALVFPELAPADFEPWIDAAAASKANKTASELAAETAESWRGGLERDGIGSDRLRRLRESQVTVYTPGSGAGVGLDVLGSMRAPGLSWDDAGEVIQEEIQSLVSSILTLAGVNSDPMSGSEHILLSTIVETMWRQGTDLDLATLVGQIPDPPFRKLGVFDVDTFISPDDRMKLALKLNGLLASPSFASWMTGVPLDIDQMIGGSGPTKAAVVYLSHLGDQERQFLVTLLLSKMVTWIRSQPGTSQLRALIYMDEMFGFAPPTAAPPSKAPILTILKQARAHGIGMVVSTQNPVDLDYKAMSNAGTWMIGRLQTENDKKRILEGLDSAAGGADIGELSRLISGLDKRQFVLHSARGGSPKVFSTRWAMSYLAGPLTREQVSTLMAEAKDRVAEGDAAPTAAVAPTAPPGVDPPAGTGDDSDVVPVVPPVAQGITVTYLDPAAPWSSAIGAIAGGSVNEAAVAARVGLLYDDTAAKLEHREEYEAVIFPLDGTVDPGEVKAVDHDDRDFRTEAPAGARYRLPEVDLGSTTFWKGLNTALKDHLAENRPITVFRNAGLKLYSRVDETEGEFAARCREAAEDAKDSAIAKLRDKYATRIDRVRDQLEAARTRMMTAEQELSAHQQGEVISGVGDLLGTFLGGRKRSNPLGQAASRRAATQKAKAKAAAEATKVTGKQREMEELESDLSEEIETIITDHDRIVGQIEAVQIPLEKSDIEIRDLKLVWVPVG